MLAKVRRELATVKEPKLAPRTFGVLTWTRGSIMFAQILFKESFVTLSSSTENCLVSRLEVKIKLNGAFEALSALRAVWMHAARRPTVMVVQGEVFREFLAAAHQVLSRPRMLCPHMGL